MSKMEGVLAGLAHAHDMGVVHRPLELTPFFGPKDGQLNIVSREVVLSEGRFNVT